MFVSTFKTLPLTIDSRPSNACPKGAEFQRTAHIPTSYFIRILNKHLLTFKNVYIF